MTSTVLKTRPGITLVDPDVVAYSTAFDLAREAAVEAEPLSAILGRVMVVILGTIPPDECEPGQLDAIKRGVADALDGRPCRTPKQMETRLT